MSEDAVPEQLWRSDGQRSVAGAIDLTLVERAVQPPAEPDRMTGRQNAIRAETPPLGCTSRSRAAALSRLPTAKNRLVVPA